MGDISRAGAMVQRDPITRQINFLAGCSLNFNEELEQVIIDAYASPAGCSVKTDIGLTEKKSSLKLTVGTKTIDDFSFEWMIVNDRKAQAASIVVPNVVAAPVTGGVITAPGLTLDQQVGVTILRTDKPGKIPLTQQPSGTGVTADTFEVGVGQITVDASYENIQALVYYFESVTNQDGWGGNRDINRYNDIEFFVKICGDKMSDKRVWFPKCTSSAGLQFNMDDDEHQREYTAFTDIQRGFTRQFAIW